MIGFPLEFGVIGLLMAVSGALMLWGIKLFFPPGLSSARSSTRQSLTVAVFSSGCRFSHFAHMRLLK